jgi:hypothetical protein
MFDIALEEAFPIHEAYSIETKFVPQSARKIVPVPVGQAVLPHSANATMRTSLSAATLTHLNQILSITCFVGFCIQLRYNSNYPPKLKRASCLNPNPNPSNYSQFKLRLIHVIPSTLTTNEHECEWLQWCVIPIIIT